MSQLKTPQQKKRASLAHDCRNMYGESPHAARNSIPKRKAMQHQQVRRVARQLLAQVSGVVDTVAAERVEGVVKAKSRLKRLKGFKKYPDTPLREVIRRKQAGRARRRT